MRFTASQSQSTFTFSPASQPFAPTSYPSPVLVSPDPCTSQTATQWELFHKLSPTSIRSAVKLKRRTSSDDDSDYEELQPPAKITLTDEIRQEREKVAARFRTMNINHEQENMMAADDDIEVEERELAMPKFHLSDEVKHVLTAPKIMVHDKLVALEREKSFSKAIILWTPPPTANLSTVMNSNGSDLLSCFGSNYVATSSRNGDNNGAVVIEEIKCDDDSDMMIEY